MKPYFALTTKVFALAVGNLLLLCAVFLLFAHYQFRLQLDSFLFAPAHDKVVDAARSFATELAQTPVADRTELAGRYAAKYQADFYVFDNDGPQLAGRPVTLPAKVTAELLRRPPGRAGQMQPRPRPPQPPPTENEAAFPPPPPRGRDRFGPPDFRPPPGRDGFGSRPPRRQLPQIADVLGPDSEFHTFQLADSGLYWTGVRIPVLSAEATNNVRGTLLISARSFWGTPLFFDFTPWLTALAAAIVVSLLCWLPFVRRLSRAVVSLTTATGRIAEGDFDRHLPVERRDEIGQLSASINRMGSRLGGFMTGQKRFLGDIAHELCAPIARTQFALGVLEQRSSGAQKQPVEDLQEEIRQMSDLVNELLLFSKAGLEPSNTHLVACGVATIARQAAAREAAPNVAINIEDSVRAMAEPGLLLRAVANLIRNSVRYAGPSSEINIWALRTEDRLSIFVSDTGPGIPDAELDRIFTPFYRLETSRNRATGGAGLGLAIVKRCAEACGGTVQCRNLEPHGLQIEICLRAA